MDNASTASPEDTTALRREIDRLKTDLHRLRTDFSGLAGDAAHAVKTGAAEAGHRAHQQASAAAAKGRESLEAVEDQVAAHPFMSLAAALTVGMVVGIAISRKD